MTVTETSKGASPETSSSPKPSGTTSIGPAVQALRNQFIAARGPLSVRYKAGDKVPGPAEYFNPAYVAGLERRYEALVHGLYGLEALIIAQKEKLNPPAAPAAAEPAKEGQNASQ